MKDKYEIFISQKDDTVVTLSGDHWNITAVRLEAHTDLNDTLTHKDEYQLFRGNLKDEIEGNVFFLEDDMSGKGMFIFADCPDFERAKLLIKGNNVKIDNHLFGLRTN